METWAQKFSKSVLVLIMGHGRTHENYNTDSHLSCIQNHMSG